MGINRTRQIKPDFFEDEKIAMVSIGARLFFIGLWCRMDKNGIAINNSRLLSNDIFPFDDDMTAKKVELLIDELCNTGFNSQSEAESGHCRAKPLLVKVKFGIKHFLYAPSFTEHQYSHHREAVKYMIPIEDLIFTVEQIALGNTKALQCPGSAQQCSGTALQPLVQNILCITLNLKLIMCYSQRVKEIVDNSVDNAKGDDTPGKLPDAVKKNIDKLLGRKP